MFEFKTRCCGCWSVVRWSRSSIIWTNSVHLVNSTTRKTRLNPQSNNLYLICFLTESVSRPAELRWSYYSKVIPQQALVPILISWSKPLLLNILRACWKTQYFQITHHEKWPKVFYGFEQSSLFPSPGRFLSDAISTLPNNHQRQRSTRNEIVHHLNHVSYRIWKDLYLPPIKIV